LKRITKISIVAVILLLLVVCAWKIKQYTDEIATGTQNDIQTAITSTTDISVNRLTEQESNIEAAAENKDGISGISTQDLQNGDKFEIIQSANVDLDADGNNEQVEVIRKVFTGEPNELEGILRINGKSGMVEVPFIKKPEGFTGIMTSIEFRDLDGDGNKDIFIISPETGAAFSLNYFFIYNYKTGKSHSYTTDSSLSDFVGSFKFEYEGKGLLKIKNDNYKFSATFNLDKNTGMDPVDENNKAYENSWIDPTPVEIGENSKLALVSTENGVTEIKVPLPVFGRATMDMIGEIDLYYQVSSDFLPVLKRFEVIDFNDGKLEKIGEYGL